MKTLSLRLLSLLPILAVAATVPACSEEKEPAAPAVETGDEDNIVDIPNTDKVSNQSIGNCWVYATSAWAEALHRRYTGKQLDISESYVSYIDWFHGIQASEFDAKDGLQTGGFFGEAADYLANYGVMDEATFIPEEATSLKSARQASALAAINTSLKTGVLSDPAKRRDRNAVRDELDKAFQLKPEVIALLDESFGHDLSRKGAAATIPAGKGLRSATDVKVGNFKPESKEISLSDAAGTASYDVNTRKGRFAWNEQYFPYSTSPASVRGFFKQMQLAAHQRMPVVVTWFVDFNAMDRTKGTFAAVPGTVGRQGGHMVVLEDYQISNVPGFGTLAAGTVVTDPKALEAALSPEATIDFIRVKNSWGKDFGPPQNSELPGYHDLYYPYLTGMIPRCDKKDAEGKCIPQSPKRGLTAFVLPPATWDQIGALEEPDPIPEPTDPPVPANTCTHSICATGAKLVSDCDPCVTKICAKDSFCCNNSWDGQCKAEVKSICGQDTCKLDNRLYRCGDDGVLASAGTPSLFGRRHRRRAPEEPSVFSSKTILLVWPFDRRLR